LILFATSEKAEMPVVLDAVDLNTLGAEVFEQMLPKAQDQKLQLRWSALEDGSLVYADREKIGWVVYQFIDNAVKFTQSGGVITLELVPDDLHVTVKVSDSGIGIPPNRLREIFVPFHQLDSSSTRKYGGTGLGLSLAQKIIEAHDSSIQVISELGRGSQFSFELKKVLEGNNR